MAKYINLSDSIFNSLCKCLLHFSSNRDPSYQVNPELGYYIEDAFERRTEDLALKYIPRLPFLDRLMIKQTKKVIQKQKISTEDSDPIWWTTNNPLVLAWSLLSEKSFKNYFNQ